MTELLRLLCFRHPSHLIKLLELAGIQEYKLYPQLIDSGTQGWWQCTPLGCKYPTQICVWVEGKRVTFYYGSGILQCIKTPANSEVTI